MDQRYYPIKRQQGADAFLPRRRPEDGVPQFSRARPARMRFERPAGLRVGMVASRAGLCAAKVRPRESWGALVAIARVATYDA